MTINKRVEGFDRLGKILMAYSECQQSNLRKENPYHEAFAILERAVEQAEQENAWFTRENILFAIRNLAAMLDKKKIERFIGKYDERMNCLQAEKTIAVIMAGNIPLVGFHDFFCVLMTRHRFLGKLSRDDSRLLPAISTLLTGIDPEFGERILFTDQLLDDFDAVIATGSNNSYRYFEFYFGKYPNILRKNRNSVAVLTGLETKRELAGLATDIFSYFGKGCRSVSKLYVPRGYPIESLDEHFIPYRYLIDHARYTNNYQYNKTIFIIDKKQFFDFGNLLLSEDSRLDTPVSVVHYEFYDDLLHLAEELQSQHHLIQCVVSHDRTIPGSVLPGLSQKPELHEFADGIDTFDFLLTLC